MDESPLSVPRPGATSKAIPSLTSSTSSKPTTILDTPKSSVSRKKPLGLDISKSIPQPTRAAPLLPSGTKDGESPWTTEADRLRQDIERLQLSSQSSCSSISLLDSPPSGSSPTAPTTPTHLAVQSDSSSSSTRKKSGSKGSKKVHKDKNGEDLVKDEDLDVLIDLGAGNGGTVTKVWNKKRKCVMARKVSRLAGFLCPAGATPTAVRGFSFSRPFLWTEDEAWQGRQCTLTEYWIHLSRRADSVIAHPR